MANAHFSSIHDKSRQIDTASLNFAKAFDRVSYETLKTEMEALDVKESVSYASHKLHSNGCCEDCGKLKSNGKGSKLVKNCRIWGSSLEYFVAL